MPGRATCTSPATPTVAQSTASSAGSRCGTAPTRPPSGGTPSSVGSQHGGQQLGQSHRGRGPKQYTRSDERILEDVCERLTDDHDIDASDIEVKAEGGSVTLEGSVTERWMKHRAEDLVDACSGVKQVDNRLRVKSSASGSSDGRSQEIGAGSSSSSGGSASSGSTSSGSSSKGSPSQQPH
ncbi:MAG: BON domain-containing protein [Proteobacteria bacterium]|nr:BON domain-containing protein [Pseudomonadota bacterium]